TSDQILLFDFLRQVHQRNPEVLSVCVADATGNVLAHHDLKELGEKIEVPLGLNFLKRGEPLCQESFSQQICVETVSMGKETHFVQAIFDRTRMRREINEALNPLKMRILLDSGICILIGLMFSLFLVRRITDPIQALGQFAARVGKGHLESTLSVSRKDELGDLAAELNHMAVQLKETDQMKQDFVSSVTHEFRSPLSAVLVYLDLLRKDPDIMLEEKAANYIEIIAQNLGRLGRFISDLLDIAKLEKGKMEVTRVPTTLNSAWKDSLVLMRSLARRKGIEIHYQLPQTELPILGDPDRLRQILTNLLSNAIKFTPEGGRIEVFTEEQEGHYLTRVQDNGRGIPPDQKPKLFEKFHQVPESRKNIKGPKGTGLGLVIVKHLVESHEGTIWVESEPGKGSTFFFTLSKNGKESKHD
ncbi:MAG: HAMP domain-containing histidine kinase, partial [Elusimicrobia bacterium]|nr:HAMP domain-containing histidine kinase [Elusimicrobiota bacterium]